jgi:hypothetical protein
MLTPHTTRIQTLFTSIQDELVPIAVVRDFIGSFIDSAIEVMGELSAPEYQ